MGRTYLRLRYDQDFDAGNLETRLVDMFIRAGIKGGRIWCIKWYRFNMGYFGRNTCL